MDNPGEPSAEDRDGNSGPGRFSLLLEPAETSGSGWPRPAGSSVHDTAPLPAHVPADLPADLPAGHRRPRGRAGRRLALGAAPRKWYLALAVYRLGIVIGAAIVIITFVGGVLLLVLPNHSVTALAGKCLPSSGGCHQIAPAAPGSVAPVTAPSSTVPLTTAATLPAASRAAT